MIELQTLAFTLTLTVAVETVVAIIIGVKGLRQYTVILLMNILTNPLINIALHLLSAHWTAGRAPFYFIILLSEAAVVFAEGMILKFFSRQLPVKPLLLSFILNLSSYLTGLIFSGLIFLYSLYG